MEPQLSPTLVSKDLNVFKYKHNSISFEEQSAPSTEVSIHNFFFDIIARNL